jgi:chromosome segregation ATPase
MIIAPCDQANLVKVKVEKDAKTYPLLYQLLCKGRFLYVVNKETTIEIVKQLREEVTTFKDQFQEQSQQLEQLREDVEQLRGGQEQLHGGQEQLHGGQEQLLGDVEQLRGDVEQLREDVEQLRGGQEQLLVELDEFKKVTLNRLDESSTKLGKIETMIELIFSKLHHS